MQLYGGGDPALADVVLANYPAALSWLRAREVAISPAMPVLHGRGYQIDIIGHLRGCAAMVEQAGGLVALETQTESLLLDASGAVVGARTRHADGAVAIKAKHVLLATGGFQGSSEMRAELIHSNARDMLLRANPHSVGDGLELGRAATGWVETGNPGFYGHLVSKSREWGLERHFTGLSQYHSDHCLLINEAGFRFCDETTGDHTNSYHTVIQENGRALCYWDAHVHAQYATRSVVAVAPPMDKMQVALENGGEGIVAGDLASIAAFADAQGFDGSQVMRTIADFNERARNGWESILPTRADTCRPLDEAPYYALVVYPAITFTFGGLRIDRQARVLRENGSIVPGLLAAGSDAGGAFGTGYAGGLALAMTFGLVAAGTAGWGD
jgi:succinate dehydrogenase/fumarate reductase flavoprotein subunit